MTQNQIPGEAEMTRTMELLTEAINEAEREENPELVQELTTVRRNELWREQNRRLLALTLDDMPCD